MSGLGDVGAAVVGIFEQKKNQLINSGERVSVM
jgi:hypothetical protein